MKKVYMTPSLEEVSLENMQTLLSGSVSSDGIGYGGVDDGSLDPESPLEILDMTPGKILGLPF